MNHAYVCPYCGHTARGGMTWAPALHHCLKAGSYVTLIPVKEAQSRQRAELEALGLHKDGSITLCPKAAEALRDIIAWSGNRWSEAGHIERIEKLKQALYDGQGVEFETLT